MEGESSIWRQWDTEVLAKGRMKTEVKKYSQMGGPALRKLRLGKPTKSILWESLSNGKGI